MAKHTTLTKWGGMAALLAASLSPLTSSAVTAVYVSAAGDGEIRAYTLNTQNGQLTATGAVAAGAQVMPMALSPDKHHLYAAVRSKPYTLAGYAIDRKTGALSPAGTAPLPDSMAYISTDRTGRWLLSASYGGNKVAVSPIAADGSVGAEAVQVVPTGKNAHSIITDYQNRFVLVSNLGSDQLLQFRFNAKTGQLTPNTPAELALPAGNGPRHLVWAPDHRTLYVSNELSGKVARLTLNKTTGLLTLRDYTDALPADAGMQPGTVDPKAPGIDNRPKIWSADLRLTPNGRFLYVSERTSSTISLLRVTPKSGQLHYVARYPTETQPRGIQIDPSGRYLIASGEKSDQLSVYRINQTSGELTLTGRFPTGKGANWIEIVTLP
ncbi:lactonase family protein [Dickeya undicola]|uniref:lactonase family protein n=1 Tax=Dickeya undicola TaxID=1577887 RepID=UPI00067DF629|nr:lactonase family protein [Dickeya undicola]